MLIHVSTAVWCLATAQNTLLAKFSIELVIIGEFLTKINISSGNYTNVLKVGLEFSFRRDTLPCDRLQ